MAVQSCARILAFCLSNVHIGHWTFLGTQRFWFPFGINSLHMSSASQKSLQVSMCLFTLQYLFWGGSRGGTMKPSHSSFGKSKVCLITEVHKVSPSTCTVEWLSRQLRTAARRDGCTVNCTGNRHCSERRYVTAYAL